MLELFKEINNNQLKEEYVFDFYLESDEIKLYFEFEETQIPLQQLEKCSSFLANLAKIEKTIFKYLLEESKINESIFSNYLKGLFEDNSKETIQEYIDFENKNKEPFLQLIEQLCIFEIALFPEEEEEFISIELGFDEDFYSEVLTITYNSDLEINYIESDN